MRTVFRASIHFLNYLPMDDRTVYDFYREHRKYKPLAVNQYNYFVKTVSGIFKVIKRMMVESEGGVYIEGFGYFACLKMPKKRKKRNSLTIRKTLYKPYFFPDSDFQDWSMSKTFDWHVRQEVAHITTPKKLHFDLCQSFRISSGYSRNRYERRPSRNSPYHYKV